MVRLDWRMLVGCLYLLFKVQSHHTDHHEEEYDHAHHDEAEEHPQHVNLKNIDEIMNGVKEMNFLLSHVCLTHFSLRSLRFQFQLFSPPTLSQ